MYRMLPLDPAFSTANGHINSDVHGSSLPVCVPVARDHIQHTSYGHLTRSLARHMLDLVSICMSRKSLHSVVHARWSDVPRCSAGKMVTTQSEWKSTTPVARFKTCSEPGNGATPKMFMTPAIISFLNCSSMVWSGGARYEQHHNKAWRM